MPSVVKITPELFPEVYASLVRKLDPQMPEEVARPAFLPPWPCDEGYFGYALADRGALVGMLGMLFSKRRRSDRTVRYCNLHSWYVRPDYRMHSLSLLRPAPALKDHTLTDFTASDNVISISLRLGFRPLDRLAVVLPPLAIGPREDRPPCDVRPVGDGDRAVLDPGDWQIYQDHQGVGCGHLLAQGDGEHCYVVYSCVHRHKHRYCLVHYISNPRMFVERHAALRKRLMRDSGGWYVAVESRLLKGRRVPLSWRVKAIDKIFRSSELEASEVDALYSEMFLFGHTTLVGAKERLSRGAAWVLSAGTRKRLLAGA